MAWSNRWTRMDMAISLSYKHEENGKCVWVKCGIAKWLIVCQDRKNYKKKELKNKRSWRNLHRGEKWMKFKFILSRLEKNKNKNVCFLSPIWVTKTYLLIYLIICLTSLLPFVGLGLHTEYDSLSVNFSYINKIPLKWMKCWLLTSDCHTKQTLFVRIWFVCSIVILVICCLEYQMMWNTAWTLRYNDSWLSVKLFLTLIDTD